MAYELLLLQYDELNNTYNVTLGAYDGVLCLPDWLPVIGDITDVSSFVQLIIKDNYYAVISEGMQHVLKLEGRVEFHERFYAFCGDNYGWSHIVVCPCRRTSQHGVWSRVCYVILLVRRKVATVYRVSERMLKSVLEISSETDFELASKAARVLTAKMKEYLTHTGRLPSARSIEDSSYGFVRLAGAEELKEVSVASMQEMA